MIARTEFSRRTVPGINFLARILASLTEKQAPDGSETGSSLSHFQTKIRVAKRGAPQLFCCQDFRPNHLNRETLQRCRGAIGRV
jgi:hypothetical protein